VSDVSTPLLGAVDQQRLDELRTAGVRVDAIGRSPAGRPLHGCLIGAAHLPLVSIVAGAHPDEPAGPLAALELLRAYADGPLAGRVRLAVVPIIDVDGSHAQRGWLDPWHGAVELPRYLEHRLRRQPGADREFGWPGAPWGGTVLPECRSAAEFLDAAGPAVAHLSLHGMFVAQGIWFLLDRLALRDAELWRDCRRIAADSGLGLHEFHRYGDKGFRRVGHGFCTTPSGPLMRRFFLAAGDREQADGFGYGSMDAARARARAAGAPPPLCAVSEFPLLRVPPELRDPRAELEACAAAPDPAAALNGFLDQEGVWPVPLGTQVDGMLAMSHAVVEAALRRSG